MKTILFPTDFSDRSNKALVHAVYYAQKFNAKLIIYHAYYRPISEHADADQMFLELLAVEKGIDMQFKKLFEANIELEKISHEFRRELGASIKNIHHIAQKGKIDLIIMATKGAIGLEQLWSTKTAFIVQKVKVPVLVLPDNTTLAGITKVGLVCDYSKEVDYHSLDFLLQILKKESLDVDVITLNRREKPLNSEELSYRLLVKKKLESVPATFHFTFNNNIDEGIIDYSKTNGLGMIAILRKNYDFLEKIFHDSLSKKMIFKSPLPLLILN